jgi:hypothetical protein
LPDRRNSELTSVNRPTHPEMKWLLGPCGAPLVEAWHSSWDRLSTSPLEWWRRSGGTPIGGSDFHRPCERRELGNPTTWLEIEDVAGALDALLTAVRWRSLPDRRVRCVGDEE